MPMCPLCGMDHDGVFVTCDECLHEIDTLARQEEAR